MGLKNCKTIRILVALAIAAALFGCGKGSDRPASGWFSENDDMASAIADTGAGGMMFMQGGMFGGGVGSIIDLTADQKQQIKAILEKYRPLQGHNFNGKRPTREEWMAMRDSMKPIRDSIKNEVLSVLTPEQKALLDQIKTQLKAGTIPDTLVKIRVQRLTSLLTLTPDQQTMAFTILRQEMQKRLDARAKDSSIVRDSSHVRDAHWQGRANTRSFGIPDTLLKILTDSQKQILAQQKQLVEKRFRKMRE
jgi:Spy/CpxP family protein refolding chaperone